MPDPQVLYIVTAVVALGLALWVIVVLARGDKAPVTARTAEAGPSLREAGGHAAGFADREPEKPAKASAPEKPVKATDSPAKGAESASKSAPPPAAGRAPNMSQVAIKDKGKGWLQSYAEIQDHGAPAAPSSGSILLDDTDEPTGPNALILVTAVGRTDPGLKRKHNEDAYAILEDHHLFVIADGMGRHAAGEVASRLCVDAITEAFQTSNYGPPREPALARRAAKLRGATLLANERVLAAAAENEAYAGMGTTVVAAYFSANNQRVYIAHVGDSRCYRLRRKELTQLTTDHTLGAAGIQGKTSSVLSRAVGVEPEVEVDMQTEAPMPGDIYLLCSDGLSRMVSGEEIQSTLVSTPDLDEATRVLTDLANRGGGRDNITVILVRVDDAKISAA
jgi:protein phosphatase